MKFQYPPQHVSSNTPATQWEKATYWKDRLLIAFVLVVFIVLNHAGSHIAATAAATGGLIGIIGHRIPAPKTWPLALRAGLAFLLWAALSALWSPYESQRALKGYMRFGFGIPLYALWVFVMSRQPPQNQTLARGIVYVLLPISALVFAVEFTSGYAITRLADPSALDGNIENNLSHGLSVLLLCFPPLLVGLWRGTRLSKLSAIMSAIALITTVLSSGNSASGVAVLLAILVMIVAAKRPKLAINIACLLPLVLLIAAPSLAIAASHVSSTQKSDLPFSWEWRVETWSYLQQFILERPLVGSGFDGLRAVTDTFTSRGFEALSVVPMHPHNFGLHIWAELGLVGVMLLCLTLLSAQKTLTQANGFTPPRALALSGTLIIATTFSSLSYSAWSDWWLGAIAIAISLTTLIPASPLNSTAIDRKVH